MKENNQTYDTEQFDIWRRELEKDPQNRVLWLAKIAELTEVENNWNKIDREVKRKWDQVTGRTWKLPTTPFRETSRENREVARQLAYFTRLASRHDNSGRSRDHVTKALEVPISALVKGLRNMGGNRESAPCPIHNEKTPSFIWYKSDNHYHCFGCGAHGDVIDLYRKQNNCGFKEAVRELIKMV